MQLTRILSLAYSIDAERVRLMTPAFAAQYACNPGAPRSPAIEAVEMIEPPPNLRISGAAYLMPKNTAQQDRKATVPVFAGGLFQRTDRAAETRVVIHDVETVKLLDRTIAKSPRRN